MANSISSPQQNVEPLPQNRLTIGFLMLWTLGTAIILACHRAIDDSQPQSALALAQSLYAVCYALVHGLAIAGVLLFIRRLFTNVGGFPTEPGHWLLLIRGFSTLAWLAGWVGRAALERLWNTGWLFTSALFLTMQFLPATAISFLGYTIALRQNTKVGRVWRLMLRLMQVNAVFGMVIAVVLLATEPSNEQMLLSTITFCIHPVIFVVLIAALAADQDSKSRDYLHWAGGLSSLASMMLSFLYRLLISVLT